MTWTRKESNLVLPRTASKITSSKVHNRIKKYPKNSKLLEMFQISNLKLKKGKRSKNKKRKKRRDLSQIRKRRENQRYLLRFILPFHFFSTILRRLRNKRKKSWRIGTWRTSQRRLIQLIPIERSDGFRSSVTFHPEPSCRGWFLEPPIYHLTSILLIMNSADCWQWILLKYFNE